MRLYSWIFFSFLGKSGFIDQKRFLIWTINSSIIILFRATLEKNIWHHFLQKPGCHTKRGIIIESAYYFRNPEGFCVVISLLDRSWILRSQNLKKIIQCPPPILIDPLCKCSNFRILQSYYRSLETLFIKLYRIR